MPTINRSRAQTARARATDNRRTKGEREAQLKMLGKVVDKLSASALNAKDITGQVDLANWQALELPDKRLIPHFAVDDDAAYDKLNLPFTAVAIDQQKGEFYINRWGDDHGPFKLPKGFVYKNLFPNTFRDPAAKTPAEKTLKALTKAIRDFEPEVYGKPFVQMHFDPSASTWRSPQGNKIHQVAPNDDRFKYGRTAFMVDLKKREFFLEDVGATSGETQGPFPLPEHITAADLEALDQLDNSRPIPSSPTSDRIDTSSRRSYSHVIGGGDSGRPISPGYASGGGGSGGSVASFYYRSRGGGGGGS